MTSAEPSPEYVLLVCSKCAARLHPRVHLAGKVVACPDCGEHLRVPQPPAQPKPKQPHAKPGAYGVAGGGSKPRPKTFAVLCPLCSARLHPRVEHVGRRVKCPDCERPFVVPTPAEQPPPPPKPDPGQYGVGSARAVTHDVTTSFLTADARMEPEKVSAAPRIWFASGVFDFPWRGETRPRWIWLVVDGFFSAVVTIVSLIVMTAVLRAGGAGGFAVMITVGVFGAFLMLPWLLTAAYAAGLLLAVIVDTANGSDEIHDWPVADVSDWGWRGGFFMISFTLAGAVGSVIGMFVVPAITSDPAIIVLLRIALVPASLFLLFPLMILSALEANSAFAVVTPTMLGRFVRHVPSCLVFYALTGVLSVVLLGPLAVGALFVPRVTLFFVGLLAGTWTLIYARLLGRLAWKIGQD